MDNIARVKQLLGGYNHDPEHAEIYAALCGVIRDAELWQKHAPAIQQMLAALDTLSPLVLTRLKLQDAAIATRGATSA